MSSIIHTHELGEMDNHTAEWAACIYALEHARELNVQTHYYIQTQS